MADIKIKKKRKFLGIVTNFSWSWSVAIKLLTIGLSFSLGYTTQNIVHRTQIIEEDITRPRFHIDEIRDAEPEGGIDIVAWRVPDDDRLRIKLFPPEELATEPVQADTIVIHQPMIVVINEPREVTGLEFPAIHPHIVEQKKSEPTEIEVQPTPTTGWRVDKRRPGSALWHRE